MSSGFVRASGRTMLHDTADFTLDTDTAEADVTVTVAGEIDLDTAGRFRDAALSALTAAPKTLRLDLAGVSFMDSTGLHALMATKRRADLAAVGSTVFDQGHRHLRCPRDRARPAQLSVL